MAAMHAKWLSALLLLLVSAASVSAHNDPKLQNRRYFESVGSKSPHPRFSGSGGEVRVLDLPDLDKNMVQVWLLTLFPGGLLMPTFVPGGDVGFIFKSGYGRALVTDTAGVPQKLRDIVPYDTLHIGADQVYGLLNIGSDNLVAAVYIILRDSLFAPIRFATLTGGKNSILAAYSDVVQRSDFNVSKALYEQVIGSRVTDDYITIAKPELLSQPLYDERPGLPLPDYPYLFNNDGRALPLAPIIRLQPSINSSQYISYAPPPLFTELAVGKGGPGAVLILNFVNNAMRYVYISEGRTRVEFASPDGFPVFRRTLRKGDIVLVPPAHPVVFVGPCDESYELFAFITHFPPNTFSLSAGFNPAAAVKNIYNAINPLVLGSAFRTDQAAVDKFFNSQNTTLYLANQNCPELFKGVFF